MLATNFDDLYGRVYSLARKQPVTLWDIEKEMFGANHGEIGACLLGMWNMPGPVVEAAALHHELPLGESEQFTPLAAVHIADVLEHQLSPGNDGMMVAPIINAAYLEELGLLQRLPVWRAAFANRRFAEVEPEVESAETDPAESEAPSSAPASRTANQLSGPASATHTTTSRARQSVDAAPAIHADRHRRLWVYSGVSVCVIALLALWLRTQPELNESEPVYARTPTAHAAVATSSTPSTTPVVPGTAPEDTPAVAVAEEKSATSTVSATVTNTPASVPAPEPTAATAAAAPTNVPSAAAIAPKKVPDFRLNGIIYAARPSAILNGETVTGATVVAIGPTAVTLQINGQRKIYKLK